MYENHVTPSRRTLSRVANDAADGVYAAGLACRYTSGDAVLHRDAIHHSGRLLQPSDVPGAACAA
jgi:hypothetical protein